MSNSNCFHPHILCACTFLLISTVLIYFELFGGSCWTMAGYEFDYIFDWTIIKYQQAQKNRTQARLSVSVFTALYFQNLVCINVFEIGLLCCAYNNVEYLHFTASSWREQ